ncbi:MAG TPA: hypothetical protein DET40_05490 [Lentisphaeria bacterium]|nr:MAG: hypothetical protein A2X45_12230 [Lentisphaerae bacterium GWF2_50_93]HCE42980.1 hypothetical protein [Lentisphaeria bacterium]
MINANRKNTDKFTDLRRKAEKKADEEVAQTDESPSPEQMRRKLHELRVQQIELEMQNEELRRIQEELDTSRKRYFDLYNLAPVGYCTLDEQGLITDANYTADKLLGAARCSLVKKPFTRFIFSEDQDIFYLYRKKLLEPGAPDACELRMVKKDGVSFWAHLEASLLRDSSGGPVTSRIVFSDISERKKAEEALAAVHRQTQSLIDNTTAMVYACDLEERFVLANAALAALLRTTPAQLLGKRRHEFMPQADADAHEATDRKVIAAGRAVEFEEHSDLHGRSITWLSTKLPLRDAQGRIYGVAGIVTDISARKQAEVALRQSEELNRSTLQALPAHISVIDQNGRIKAVNQAWTEFASSNDAGGLATVEVGANYLDVCRRAATGNDADAARALVGIESVLGGSCGQFTLEYPCHSPNQQRWFLMTVAPLGDGGGAVITHLNISERKNAEEKLEQTRSILTEAQRIAHLGSWEYIVETQTTVWSDEQKRIYGLDPAGPSPVYEEMLRRYIHPDDAAALDKAFGEALRTGSPFENENRIIRPDGSVRFIYNKAQPYFDGTGKLIRYVGATLDITERRQAEEQIKKRVNELSKANTELKLFEKVAVGRELRMVELKKEINKLCAAAGQPPKYP